MIELTQKRHGYFDHADQQAADNGRLRRTSDFLFRGGCTLLIDAETRSVRYCVVKNVLSDRRIQRARDYLIRREGSGMASMYLGSRGRARNPFRMLHSDE